MISLIISIMVVFIAVLGCLIYRLRIKKMLDQLHHMVDEGISGTFEESTYDESSLSALEQKMGKFLSMSSVSKKALEKDQRRTKALISDISHQTKTPLANIMLYSQLLKEEDTLPKTSKESINQIVTQSQKLDFLIKALVKASRLESGMITVKPEKESVKELLYALLDKIALKAKEKQIDITLTCKQEEAFFDFKWTEEALYNILENGVKYTQVGGKLILTVIEYELFCRIDIKDTGIGIKEEEINEIFKRFYRSPSVHQYEGVGIGLFLSREIIEAEGGYIKVTSNLKEGSTFSVFLPKTI